MNFDQTCIAIRKRSLLEILDLALHVVRDHFGPLLVLWSLGVIPFLTADWLAIGWLASDVYDPDQLALFQIAMVFLISNQAQVALIFVTGYLGQAMFSPRPSLAESIRSGFLAVPRFVWVHGILRMVAPVLLIAFLLSPESPDTFVGFFALLVFLSLVGLFVRCLRPFVSEILLLEKTPVRNKQGSIGFPLRSASLHKAASSELTGRFILLAGLAVPLTLTFLGTLLLVDSWLNLFANGSAVPLIIYGPISMWITAGLLAVARFLSYIDIRIRQEGWEVELRLRAEAVRLEGAPG